MVRHTRPRKLTRRSSPASMSTDTSPAASVTTSPRKRRRLLPRPSSTSHQHELGATRNESRTLHLIGRKEGLLSHRPEPKRHPRYFRVPPDNTATPLHTNVSAMPSQVGRKHHSDDVYGRRRQFTSCTPRYVPAQSGLQSRLITPAGWGECVRAHELASATRR